MGSTHVIGKKYSYMNLIQIWHFKFIETQEEEMDGQASKFCLGIGHEHGTIFDLKWCPQSNISSQESGDSYSRLGLLAVATSDGQLIIYSVPEPSQLHSSFPLEEDEKFLIVRLQPVFSSDLQSQYIINTLSWRIYDEVYLLLAGTFGGSFFFFKKVQFFLFEIYEKEFFCLQSQMFRNSRNLEFSQLYF